MIVLLDHEENILEFLDDDLADIEVTDVYKGYETLELQYVLSDIIIDKYLFKQGNKILVDNCLFVINSECEFDYVKNIIKIDAEEIISELNFTKPFYINDATFNSFVTGNTIQISLQFLQRLLPNYTILETDLSSLKKSDKLLTVNGTITVYDLLKQIEELTGLVFKRNYEISNNKIIKQIKLLKPTNYGQTHDKLIESVELGHNANKLLYLTDESKNALGIMPIITSEDTENVKYSKILKQFYNLDINNEKIEPNLYKYEYTKEELQEISINVLAKTKIQGYIPEKILTKNDELEIGVAQFLDLLAQSIVIENTEIFNQNQSIVLNLIKNVEYSRHSIINGIFTREEIIVLAQRVNKYCSVNFEVPAFLKTSHGICNSEMLTYILMNYIISDNHVVLNTEKYPLLSKISSDFVQENIYTTNDWENLEYMPFLYTQNSSSSSKIPTSNSVNGSVNVVDIDNYISESYPTLVIKKTANATQMHVKIYSQGIVDDEVNSFFVAFKDPTKIKDDSDITIDFSKKTIKYTKYVETTVTKEVKETNAKDGVITVTGKNTCGCCGYPKMPYKNYTRTFEDYCPACGRRGTLVFNPKRVVDGEITCGNTGPACKNGGTKNGKSYSKGSIRGCDADYCCQCGGDKWGSGRCRTRKLTPANSVENTTKTVTETSGEYKEITAGEEDSTSEDKEKLSDVVTEQSTFDAFYGRCSIELSGCTFVSLNCESTKLFELSSFPYIKHRGEQFIYAPVNFAEFNYTHVEDNNPKLEKFETTEQSVEEVLIGCWKKLNGSGDNTKWLEKSENISVDLVETEETRYDVGDFVYINLPDNTVFKAQITEKSFNPKIKEDCSLKIGNITRESML